MARVVRPDVDEGFYLDGCVVIGGACVDRPVVGVYRLFDRENARAQGKRHPTALPAWSLALAGGVCDLDYRHRLELIVLGRRALTDELDRPKNLLGQLGL